MDPVRARVGRRSDRNRYQVGGRCAIPPHIDNDVFGNGVARLDRGGAACASHSAAGIGVALRGRCFLHCGCLVFRRRANTIWPLRLAPFRSSWLHLPLLRGPVVRCTIGPALIATKPYGIVQRSDSQ